MPKRKQSWISQLVANDGDPRHGYTGYSTHGCRCDICREAKRAYQAALRDRRAAARKSGEAAPTHGTRTTYVEYRCRCTPCVNAQRAAKTDYYQRVRQGGAA